MTLSDSELTTDFQDSLTKSINPGSVVTQPMQSFRLQLKVVIRFLRGLLINHDTPPLLPASGRIQFAPVYLNSDSVADQKMTGNLVYYRQLNSSDNTPSEISLRI